ncbi:MAG: acetyl-CoA carboxylase biotin carboxyl carrier protein subunit [Flavobacteriales bacterium]|jgi:biotin carboxyl carrier protein|nr:acetyl-CoA carboxylase biotin carboxyl carrier protein subunit [Flavobacteriales bacterium]
MQNFTMDESFKVIVNDSFEFSLLRKEIESLDLLSEENKLHLLHENRSVEATILDSDFNNRSYTLKINGKRYTVKLESELDALIEEMGLSLGADAVENEVHAPMPGLILEVNVSEGQEVKEGDALCVLEAMKMENALMAPRDGVIKSVQIAKGDAVEKGMLLIELEAI